MERMTDKTLVQFKQAMNDAMTAVDGLEALYGGNPILFEVDGGDCEYVALQDLRRELGKVIQVLDAIKLD